MYAALEDFRAMLPKPTTFALLLLGSTTLACATAQAPTSGLSQPSAIREASPRSTPVYEKGGSKLIATVGKAGGRLELGNGARLEIPEGALSEAVEITFSEGTHSTAFSNHEYEKPVGPILEVSPPLQLNQSFRVSIPATRLPEGFEASDLTLAVEVPADEQRAVQMHGVQTRWDYLPARSEDGRAVGELSAVPGYRVQFVVSRDD
jgi:hypothetical protein